MSVLRGTAAQPSPMVLKSPDVGAQAETGQRYFQAQVRVEPMILKSMTSKILLHVKFGFVESEIIHAERLIQI